MCGARPGGLCWGHGSSRATAAAGCAGAPGRARGGLAALQRIRQRHSLCRRCPPLFSPGARGDAPVLPRLPESVAVLAPRVTGIPASPGDSGAAPLPSCCGAAARGLGSIAGRPGQTDGWTDGSSSGCARDMWAAGPGAAGWWRGNIGEGDERRSRSPAKPVAGTAPVDLLITGHRRGSQTGTAVPWPAQGRAPHCDKQHPAALEGVGTVHGSGELPGMVETTTTFIFPAKGSSQAAAPAAASLGVT